MRERTIEILLRAKAQDSLPELLRSLQHVSDHDRERSYNGVMAVVDDKGITFPQYGDHDPLSEMVRTLDWARHAFGHSQGVQLALEALRSSLVARQRA